MAARLARDVLPERRPEAVIMPKQAVPTGGDDTTIFQEIAGRSVMGLWLPASPPLQQRPQPGPPRWPSRLCRWCQGWSGTPDSVCDRKGDRRRLGRSFGPVDRPSGAVLPKAFQMSGTQLQPAGKVLSVDGRCGRPVTFAYAALVRRLDGHISPSVNGQTTAGSVVRIEGNSRRGPVPQTALLLRSADGRHQPRVAGGRLILHTSVMAPGAARYART
jgi:hypothetical protein